jgi:hypothetical protein
MPKSRSRKSIPSSPGARAKIHKVMSEFKEGTLHSGKGGKVRSRKQAIAIALAEARRRRKG